MKTAISVLLLIIMPLAVASAQHRLTLQEAIAHAQHHSPHFRLAQHQKEVRRLEHLAFKSELKPQISLYGSLPSFKNSYNAITQPDGGIVYLPIRQNLGSLGLSLSQRIGLTGGEFSLNSDLNRFDNFKTNFTQYNGTPVFLRLFQPIFGFNELKWRKKIDRLQIEESKKNFWLEMENIAEQTTTMYFNMLEARLDIQNSATNLQDATENLRVEQRRINLGTTSEDKILQLELGVLTGKQQLKIAQNRLRTLQMELVIYIGFQENDSISVEMPDSLPSFQIDRQTAIQYANLHRPEPLNYQKRLLEAQSQVAKAKAQQKKIDLVATLGLNNAGPSVKNVYEHPNAHQTVSLGFNVPIIDWGRSKTSIDVAKSYEKLVTSNYEIEQMGFRMKIQTIIDNFTIIQENIQLAQQAMKVALRRHEIAGRLYRDGKLSLTELNISQAQRNEALSSYLRSLKAYWQAFYALRKATGFDFVQQVTLEETYR